MKREVLDGVRPIALKKRELPRCRIATCCICCWNADVRERRGYSQMVYGSGFLLV